MTISIDCSFIFFSFKNLNSADGQNKKNISSAIIMVWWTSFFGEKIPLLMCLFESLQQLYRNTYNIPKNSLVYSLWKNYFKKKFTQLLTCLIIQFQQIWFGSRLWFLNFYFIFTRALIWISDIYKRDRRFYILNIIENIYLKVYTQICIIYWFN